LLDGGQSWPEPPLPPTPPAASLSDGTSVAADQRTTPKRKAVITAPANTAGLSLEKPIAPATGAVPTAATDFAQGMAAFSAGDYGRAEQLFNAFEARHPSDARVEDATFLKAVARSRRGDSAGARALAREYLVRYPNGLRHLEAQRLAR
jgi:TolA-binding protein